MASTHSVDHGYLSELYQVAKIRVVLCTLPEPPTSDMIPHFTLIDADWQDSIGANFLPI